MRDISQTNGCTHTPVPRHPGHARAGGVRLATAVLAAGLALAGAAQAQTMKLGPFYLDAAALMELGYESNVDGVYPHEEDSSKKNADFYWMPGLSLKSQPVPMRPSSAIAAAACVPDAKPQTVGPAVENEETTVVVIAACEADEGCATGVTP